MVSQYAGKRSGPLSRRRPFAEQRVDLKHGRGFSSAVLLFLLSWLCRSACPDPRAEWSGIRPPERRYTMSTELSMTTEIGILAYTLFTVVAFLLLWRVLQRGGL